MHIDCDSCAARGPACADCVVTVLLGAPDTGRHRRVELDGAEQAAIAVLAGSGLVPPLRLLPLVAAESLEPGEAAGEAGAASGHPAAPRLEPRPQPRRERGRAAG